MKRILVPTDFSLNADNALNYALKMATALKSELIVMHCYNVDASPANYDEEEIKLKRHSDIYLKVAETKIKNAGNIPYKLLSLKGTVVDSVVNAIKNEMPDLIIMGTKGESNLTSVIFGSNTGNVIAKAECPVIAVPEGASFGVIKKITFATDYRTSDFGALKKLLEIAKPFHAQLNILHVNTDRQSTDNEVKLMDTFMKQANKVLDYNSLSFQIMEGDDLITVLTDYLDNGGCDLLVMSSHQRNWWDKLFGHSFTNDMIYNMSVPVMAVYHNKKADINLY